MSPSSKSRYLEELTRFEEGRCLQKSASRPKTGRGTRRARSGLAESHFLEVHVADAKTEARSGPVRAKRGLPQKNRAKTGPVATRVTPQAFV